MTVVLEIPSRAAIRAFGTPSAASLLISAQSSKVITLQSLSAHFSPPKVFSFRAPPTTLSARPCDVSGHRKLPDLNLPATGSVALRVPRHSRGRQGADQSQVKGNARARSRLARRLISRFRSSSHDATGPRRPLLADSPSVVKVSRLQHHFSVAGADSGHRHQEPHRGRSIPVSHPRGSRQAFAGRLEGEVS